MNTIQEALSSKRTLKKFLLECDFTFLSTLHEQITATLTERKAEHEAQEQQRKEREIKRLELIELIKAEGFSPVSTASPKRRNVNQNTSISKEALPNTGQVLAVFRWPFSRNWMLENLSNRFLFTLELMV